MEYQIKKQERYIAAEPPYCTFLFRGKSKGGKGKGEGEGETGVFRRNVPGCKRHRFTGRGKNTAALLAMFS